MVCECGIITCRRTARPTAAARPIRRNTTMPKVHSHYENLKVARDASQDEIRAAYRSLTRKHHPDRNPDNADSQRVMSVINVAYGVLSDAAKRLDHDRWIKQAESPSARPAPVRETMHVPPERYRKRASAGESDAVERARRAGFDKSVRNMVAHVARHRAAYAAGGVAGVCALAGAIWLSLSPEPGVPVVRARAAEAQQVPGYARAPSAPNGEPWPTRSGYVDGYPQMNKGGLSDIKVDNAGSDADMFVKLVSIDGLAAFPVRTFYVAGRSHLLLEGLTPGTYELRYRNLVSGGLWRSPVLIVEEVATDRGRQHTSLVANLYASTDGSMKSYALLDTEF